MTKKQSPQIFRDISGAKFNGPRFIILPIYRKGVESLTEISDPCN